MSVEIKTEIHGIKASLKELNTIDKRLRRQITKDFKKIVEDVVSDAESNAPRTSPISGMNRKWVTKSGFALLPWRTYEGKQVVAGTSGKAVKEFAGHKQNVAAFYVLYRGPQAALFDITGKSNPGSRLGKSLAGEFGSPSRVMWPAYQRHRVNVDENMQLLVNKIGEAVGRNLK